jgi:hypothetical protein
MSDEPIPLYEGDLSSHVILPDSAPGRAESAVVRSRRACPRKNCEDVHVCFSPESESGLPDNAECSVLDISVTGMAIEYDRPLARGVSANVSYYTISRIPVRVSCTVRHCAAKDNGYFQIGLQLNRPLKFEERKPMRIGAGRVVSPHVRARKLQPPKTDNSTTAANPSSTPMGSDDLSHG